MTDALNNPYILYPGFPMSGYHNYEIYNTQLMLLKKYIDTLTSHIETNKKSIILHFTFGSAMEECNDERYDFQWRQLFPYHLEKATILYPKTEIINIVISPNKTFEIGTPNYKSPNFVEKSDIKFMDYMNGTICAKETNYVTRIFCTMMPSIDINNKIIIDKFKEKKGFEFVNFDQMTQTSYDIEYTTMFYNSMKRLVNTVVKYNGCVTAFSFAVFNKESEKSRFNGYYLFKEIESVFQHSDKVILCEWIFYLKSVILIDKLGKKINYIKPFKGITESLLDGMMILINKYDTTYILEYIEIDKWFRLNLNNNTNIDDINLILKQKSNIVNIDMVDELYKIIIDKLELDIEPSILRKIVNEYMYINKEQYDDICEDILIYNHLICDIENIYNFIEKHGKDKFIHLYTLVNRDKDISLLKKYNFSNNLLIGGNVELNAISQIFDCVIDIDIINSMDHTDIINYKHSPINKTNKINKYIKIKLIDNIFT